MTAGGTGELDEIRARLESVVEQLADLAIVRLREAVEAGERSRPADERRITRARRAVEKAVAVLGETKNSGDR